MVGQPLRVKLVDPEKKIDLARFGLGFQDTRAAGKLLALRGQLLALQPDRDH